MSTEPVGPEQTIAGRDQIMDRISNYLTRRLSADIEIHEDIYERGLVASMFAMELVVQLEQGFQIEILGADLQLANFRTVETMTNLVLRLQSGE